MPVNEIAELVLPYVRLVVSWPVVVPVVLLTFRKPLIHLLEVVESRLTKAQIGPTSFEFSEPKTTETDVGKTNVSAIPTEFETDSYVFRSRRFGCEISYPVNDQWTLDPEPDEGVQRALGQIMVLTLRLTCPIDGFTPNVNVVVQPTGDMTIKQYMAQTLQGFAQNGFKMISFDIDTKTEGATISYISIFPIKDQDRQLELKNVARVILENGFGYLVTSTILADSKPPGGLLEQMNSIINSFQVTKK